MHWFTVFLQFVFIGLYGLMPGHAVAANMDWEPVYIDSAQEKPDNYQPPLSIQSASVDAIRQGDTASSFIYHGDAFSYKGQRLALNRQQQKQRTTIIQQRLKQLSFSAGIRFVELYRNTILQDPIINLRLSS